MQYRFSYPSSIIQTINSVIKECAASTGLYPTQANPSQYLCSFFTMDESYYIPDNAFLCIWYNLIQFQRLEKSYWIKSYWEQAVSYANLHLDGYLYYDNHNDNRKHLLFRFKQFHHVYCGYLLSCKEYPLLAHMRGFSNSIPYSNCLVPDQLKEICDQMAELDPIYNPLYMDSHYNFFQVNGVNDGQVARAWTYRYYGICCLVEPFINFDLYLDGLSIQEKINLDNQISTLVHFISEDPALAEIIENPLFIQNFKILQGGKEKCVKILTDIKGQLQSRIDSDRKNQISSEDPILNFKTEVNGYIKKAVDTNNLPFFFKNDLHDQLVLKINNQIIDRDFFSDEPLISYVGFTDTYSSFIMWNLNLMFANQIKLNSPRKKYYIDYFEMQDALNALCLDKDYCIISLGIEIPNDIQFGLPKENIHSVRTQYSELLIMPKSECPFLILLENPVNIEIDPIPDSVKESIKASVPYRYNQQNFIHYIVLKIIFRDYEGIPSQLSEIIPIKKLV